MRLVTAIVVWLLLLGGMRLYMEHRQEASSVSDATNPSLESVRRGNATGAFALEILPSFALEPDPFALLAAPADAAPSLVVRLNGAEVLRRDERVEADTPLRIQPVDGLLEGANEFHIEANPPLQEHDRPHAVRIRLTRDGRTVAEQTLWAEPGTPIADTFTALVEAGPPGAESDDHAH
jgi:hypothetical protein